jgi:transcriptional regulator with XRE-family HTH domain
VANLQPVGGLLREWRERRRLSQLSLALAANVSARHVSFIETNRSKPSREMLARLSDELDIPFDERNALLLAAGYAPQYERRTLDDAALQPVRAIIDTILAAPLPTIILDKRWNIITSNASARLLVADVDPVLLQPQANALRITLDPRGMAPSIVNLAQYRSYLLQRLRREARFSGDPVMLALHEELAAIPSQNDEPTEMTGEEIAVPLRLRHQGRELAFLNTIATFGTAVDASVSDLMIEVFYPI